MGFDFDYKDNPHLTNLLVIYKTSFTMMRNKLFYIFFFLGTSLASCNDKEPGGVVEATIKDADQHSDSVGVVAVVKEDSIQPVVSSIIAVDTQKVSPTNIVEFAKTQIGVPYKYASTDPAQGFDCSGFITYVFKHFNIAVPRSSVDFTNVGTDIPLADAKSGDLILFTGTDSASTVVGHMGIVTENTDSLRFIHSTSGKQYGVTITALGNYYQRRFVKVIRIF